MKTAIVVLAALAATAGARLLPGTGCSEDGCWISGLVRSAFGADSAEPGVVTGRYVEARTASVFAGACHYNGEYTTQGRRGALAFAIESGSVDGVDLSGVAFAAAVASDQNLAEGGPRRSVLYLPEDLDARRTAALHALVLRELGDVLGTIERSARTSVVVRTDGERYVVQAGDELALEGLAMADRACCKMPLNVWYDPLAPVADEIVGESASFRLAAEELGPAFERKDENDAFLGTFRLGARPVSAAAACCDSDAVGDVDA